jgi:hypothetical protein
MLQNSRSGNNSSGHLPPFQNGSQERAMRISARHQLLSDSWTADVEELEWAIGRFKVGPDVATNCQVAFFEMVGDERLHCNVTHRHATKSVIGWAGPGRVAGGFVHNRRFGDTPQKEIVRHIRDMVFAARI